MTVGQTLTPQQVQQLLAGQQQASSVPVQASGGMQVGQTLNPQQVQALLAGKPVPPTASPQAPQENPLQAVGTALKSSVQKIDSDFSENTGSLGSEITTGAKIAGDITSVPANAIGASIGSVVPPQIKQVAGTALQATADAITSNPEALKALNTINSLTDKHPQIAQLLGGLGTTAFNIASAETGGNGVQPVAEAGTELASKAKGAFDEAMAPAPAPNPDAVAAQHQASLTKEWQAPASQNKASFNTARKVLAQNPQAPETLAKMGINPSAYVEDGAYNTQELASEIRDQAAQESSKQLRPALQLADSYTAPKPVADIAKDATERVNADSSLTRGQKASAIKQINTETAAMKEQYPDGLSLTAAHDEKITYAQNAGFSPIKDPAADNIATGNRYLAQALAKNVEENAPENLPVHQVNQDLSKAYGAADYLDALHTKKAPVTPVQTAARFAAKFGGAAIASHVPILGGELISDFAGYQIGKYVEKALENMSKPGRAQYLANLKKYEPESYANLQSFIEKNQGATK